MILLDKSNLVADSGVILGDILDKSNVRKEAKQTKAAGIRFQPVQPLSVCVRSFFSIHRYNGMIYSV